MHSTTRITPVVFIVILLSITTSGCGRKPSATSDLAAIEGAIADYTIATLTDGDPLFRGGTNRPKTIQILPRWADFPQIENETADGDACINHISQLTFFISIGGDSVAVVEQIANAIRADRSIADQLLHHPDPRVRYATLYTLEQSQPYSQRFPESSESVIDSLIKVTSSADLFEIVKALDLLPREFRMDAFTNGMSHPCSQLRLAALNYLTFSDLDDSQRISVLPVLVEQLKHRDRVVRETAFSEINSIMQHWRQRRHDKLNVAPEILELIQTVPSDPGNGTWQQTMASVSKSLIVNHTRWVDWLDANHISVLPR